MANEIVGQDLLQHGYDARAVSAIDARKIAREEIASLSGMFLRRLQDVEDEEHLSAADMRSLWGEALADFSSESSPGPAPQNVELSLGDEIDRPGDELETEPQPAA